MITPPVNRLILVCLLLALSSPAVADRPGKSGDRLLLAHYMPWYVAKPHSEVWGWHWTMNHFDPDQVTDGKRAIASHFYPQIGPYDSGDPDVIDYHLLLMKLAGIDGVIVDWYGLEDFRDYATLHRNTTLLVERVKRLRMKLVICYEDQTIPALVEAGRLEPSGRVAHATAEINWLAKSWFQDEGYARIDGKPVLLSFGHAGLTDDEWTQCLNALNSPVAYFSEHYRRAAAIGGFDWPVPKRGLQATIDFEREARGWPESIPVAFPRFLDIYEQAQVHDGYGRIEDAGGATLRRSLERALRSDASVIQIATWNDWGEGTSIEPSREYGYRDLEVIQSFRRRFIDANFRGRAADLPLATELYRRRKANAASDARWNLIADKLAELKTDEVRRMLNEQPSQRAESR